ncbi:thiamine diphosphate-binding protein [Xylariaceae sp. FL0804]|nr:thiamine diphosphate-binding protein [Xylariaceae sp. FL0804]
MRVPFFTRAQLRRVAAQAGRHHQRPSPAHVRCASGISQRPGASHVSFPGAVKSAFTSELRFARPSDQDALPTYRVVDQDGQIVDQSFTPDLGDEEVVRLYKTMLTVSIMDLVMFDAQRQGRLSFYMVSAGEEALSVGSASALDPRDVVFCQYREQGVFAQRGFTLDDFMNQLFANHKDSGRGRNMPVHYGSRELNIHTISSPLATQIPQASGAAYALKMQRINDPSLPPRVAAVYFGEGAASEGDFHAALNIAATRSCPVLFICRNNGYAISTPTLEQYRGDGIASRGVGYGIDTVRVDGNDLWAVREAVKRARRMALGLDGTGSDGEGQGGQDGQGGGGGCRPVLVEAMSYRVSHHSTSDDSFAYRARVEVEDWKRRDNPVSRLRKYLEGRGAWDETRERGAREEARRDVLRAFARAERERKPPLRAMFEDVYEELTPELRAQMAELRAHLDRYPDEYDVGEYVGGRESLDG